MKLRCKMDRILGGNVMGWGESGRIGAEAPCPRGDGPFVGE